MSRIPVVPVDGTDVSATPAAAKRITAELVPIKVTGVDTDVVLQPGEDVVVDRFVHLEPAEPAKGFVLVSPAGPPVADGTLETVEAALIAAGLLQ